MQRGLRVGDALDEAAMLELDAAAERDRATTAALRFVSFRPRSERETRDRLRAHGFSADAIDAAIERMRGWRYLDDGAFAEFWVASRAEHAPRGRRALEAELRAKGVDRAVANEIIDATNLREDEAAFALASKRLASLRGLDEATQKRRLAAFLGRRGYGWDVITPVFARLFARGTDEGDGSFR